MTINVTDSVARLFRIQIARLNLRIATERLNRASIEIEHHRLFIKIKEWESRTGLDHNSLLKGDYDNPYNKSPK